MRIRRTGDASQQPYPKYLVILGHKCIECFLFGVVLVPSQLRFLDKLGKELSKLEYPLETRNDSEKNSRASRGGRRTNVYLVVGSSFGCLNLQDLSKMCVHDKEQKHSPTRPVLLLGVTT